MLLDTSVIVEMMRYRRPYQYASVSSITVVEIVRAFKTESEMVESMNFMRRMFYVYEIDDEVILSYSKLYQALKENKQKMADADLIIAATSLAKNEVLYTKDHDFEAVEKLVNVKIE